jgi:hypothetical protein
VAYRAAIALYAGELLLDDRYQAWAQSCGGCTSRDGTNKEKSLKTNEPYSTPTYPSEGHRKRERLGKVCLLGGLCLHPGGNLGARRQVQLLEDVADVVLHGALREHELLGDPAVGESSRH